MTNKNKNALDRIENNKKILFSILEKNNIKEEFVISFNGYGDSGQIEDVSGLDDILLEEPVVGAKILMSTCFGPEGVFYIYWGDDPKDPHMTVRDVAESLCYDILNINFRGWENNEGAYGDFIFSPRDNTVYLDFKRNNVDDSIEIYEESY